MRKIPTLFERDPNDRRFVVPRVAAGCEWVLAGEGIATRQYDGVCVLFDPLLGVAGLGVPMASVPELQGWWVRRYLKPGTPMPEEYVTVEVDETTGKTVGWEPADRSAFAKFLTQAVAALTDEPRVGTHELLGPRINRNPEHFERHTLVAHADADVLDAPRDYEGLRLWLHQQPYEGVVWHWQQPDGTVRMAKLKKRDIPRG